MIYPKKILSLSKTICIINFSVLNIRHKFKNSLNFHFFILLFFILACLSTIYFSYFKFAENIYINLLNFNNPTIFITLIMYGLKVMMIFISMFLIINLFCLSRDTQALSVFPIKLTDIFLSKYILIVNLCYVIEFIVLVPMLIQEMFHAQPLQIIINYLSVGLVLPHIAILPLIIILIGSFKLSFILKCKPHIICSIGFILYVACSTAISYISIGKINMHSSQNELIISVIDILKPFAFFQAYLSANMGIKILISISIPLLSLVLCYFVSCTLLSERYYNFKEKTKNIKTNTIYAHRPRFRSYLLKETRNFFRSPAYVINGLFGVIVTPFLLPLSFQMSTDTKNIDQIRELIKSSEFSTYSVFLGICVIAATSAINVVASSSFSREGASFWIIKIIPYNMLYQALAKTTFSILTLGSGIFLNTLVYRFYFGFSFIQSILIFVVCMAFNILWSLVGVFIDISNPKLNWINESEAIKQNINVLMATIVCLVLSAGYFFISSLLIDYKIQPVLVVLIILLSISAISIIIYKRIALIAKEQ